MSNRRIGVDKRIIGMQSREYQMAGHGSTHADFCRILIAHFADQDDVRILSQG
jgi:hypothetical protein